MTEKISGLMQFVKGCKGRQVYAIDSKKSEIPVSSDSPFYVQRVTFLNPLPLTNLEHAHWYVRPTSLSSKEKDVMSALKRIDKSQAFRNGFDGKHLDELSFINVIHQYHNKKLNIGLYRLILAQIESNTLCDAFEMLPNQLKDTIIYFPKDAPVTAYKDRNIRKFIEIVFNPKEHPNGWLDNFNLWLNGNGSLPELTVNCRVVVFAEHDRSQFAYPVLPPALYKVPRVPYFTVSEALELIKRKIRSCKLRCAGVQPDLSIELKFDDRLKLKRPISSFLEEQNYNPILKFYSEEVELSENLFKDEQATRSFCDAIYAEGLMPKKVNFQKKSIPDLLNIIRTMLRQTTAPRKLVKKYKIELNGELKDLYEEYRKFCFCKNREHKKYQFLTERQKGILAVLIWSLFKQIGKFNQYLSDESGIVEVDNSLKNKNVPPKSPKDFFDNKIAELEVSLQARGYARDNYTYLNLGRRRGKISTKIKSKDRKLEKGKTYLVKRTWGNNNVARVEVYDNDNTLIGRVDIHMDIDKINIENYYLNEDSPKKDQP